MCTKFGKLWSELLYTYDWHKLKQGDTMITCDVCGHLNDPSAAICENCGSDLSDSPDWGYNYYED